MTVWDARAAAVLTDEEALEKLEPFFRSACTVSEAAQASSTNANTMYHLVKRWERLGLIEVVTLEARRGRALKRYRTVAESFFVPFEVTAFPTLGDTLEALDQRWETRLRQSVVKARRQVLDTWGYVVRHDSTGGLHMTSAEAGREVDFLGPDEPAVLSAWCDSLYLTPVEAKALQKQLHRLLGPREQTSERKRYLLRLGLAPL